MEVRPIQVFDTEVTKARMHKTTNIVEHARAGFNVASLQEVEFLMGAGRSGFEDLDENYESDDPDLENKEEMAFDIVNSKGIELGQTLSLWVRTEGQDGNRHTQGTTALWTDLEARREYTVAVVAACRSNRKLAPKSDDRQALTVLVLEEDIDRNVYRRLAIGAVDPDPWKLAEPEWKTLVLA